MHELEKFSWRTFLRMLMSSDANVNFAHVILNAGFSLVHSKQFSRDRVDGVTLGRFRTRTKTIKNTASLCDVPNEHDFVDLHRYV
jgi:hypothetical protein